MSPSPLTPPSPGQPRVSRRTVLIGGALALGASSLGAAGLWWPRSGPTFATLAEKPLHAHTVAFLTDTARVAVSDPSEVIPGTRVAMNAHNPAELVAREAQWLASLAPWTRDSAHADLIRDAYLDMFVLSEGLEAPVAGWTPLWRYVWPRDTAHIAVAFAAAGDVNRAQRALDFLARVPRTARGWFEARYTLDARGPRTTVRPSLTGWGGRRGRWGGSPSMGSLSRLLTVRIRLLRWVKQPMCARGLVHGASLYAGMSRLYIGSPRRCFMVCISLTGRSRCRRTIGRFVRTR